MAAPCPLSASLAWADLSSRLKDGGVCRTAAWTAVITAGAGGDWKGRFHVTNRVSHSRLRVRSNGQPGLVLTVAWAHRASCRLKGGLDGPPQGAPLPNYAHPANPVEQMVPTGTAAPGLPRAQHGVKTVVGVTQGILPGTSAERGSLMPI